MIKRELEKLRTLNATPAMVKALEKPGEEKDYWGKRHKYKYCFAARCQNLNGYLKVSICTREDVRKKILTPKWDVFINYDGDEYITRERQKDGSYKWRTAYIFNLEDDRWYRRDYDSYMYMNPEGSKEIQNLLGTKDRGFTGICQWQQGCKKRIEDKKIKQLTDRWDEEMKPIKEPPGGFEDWWKHHGFDGDNFIFYASANATEGYCTSCIGKVKLQHKPKHNEDGRCPVCGKRVTYKSRGKKTSNIWSNFREVSCIQRYKDGLVQRDFNVRRIDIKDAETINKSDYTIWEKRRTLILGDSYKVFVYEDYRRRGNRWAEDKDNRIERYTEKMYPRNLKQLLKNFHTAYPIAVERGYKAAGLRYFLTMEKKYPVIEMAYKAGLCELAEDMLQKNWILGNIIKNRESELPRILNIDKARMKRLKEMKGDIRALIWLQKEKVMDTMYRDIDISTLSKAELEPETIERSKIGKYLSVEKICNYLNKQAEIRLIGKYNALVTVWRDWNDYVNMMEKMKMDCSNELLLKPKDLAIAHNELVARISMLDSKKQITEKEKKFKKAQKLMQSGELKKYEYSDGKYCIVAPNGIDEIFNEGITLKHCIHTCDIYFQRIDIRETYLLFLRRTEAPDKPWYTIEIEPGGNIRQKKSVLNEAYKDLDDAIPFLQKWQKWVKKNLSDEDKKLAEKSDQARKEGYKKLREEKKIIWHGRLQGTLLADALEDDFMEVI